MFGLIRSFTRAAKIGGKYWTNFIGLDKKETIDLSVEYVIKHKIHDLPIIIYALTGIHEELEQEVERLSAQKFFSESSNNERLEDLRDALHDLEGKYQNILQVILDNYTMPYRTPRLGEMLDKIFIKIEQARMIAYI